MMDCEMTTRNQRWINEVKNVSWWRWDIFSLTECRESLLYQFQEDVVQELDLERDNKSLEGFNVT